MELGDQDFSKEFVFNVSRSGGAGGQNVNKVSTKIELKFHVETSELLSEEQKEILKQKLKNKINAEGFLQIISQEHRTQLANKEKAIEKFYLLVKTSLIKQKARKPSKPTFASKRQRLAGKKINSIKKASRGKGDFEL